MGITDQKSETLTLSAVEEINQLHSEILGDCETIKEKAIRIGELLTLAKNVLKHGEWLEWIENNCPFSDQQARNYMRVFDRRDDPKFKHCLNISDIYMDNGSSEDTKQLQRLHEPNFHSQAVRLRQNLVALFNHHLQRRPLKVWHTEEIYDLLCSLRPMTEICSQLELELNTRNDVPAAYRQSNGR